MVCFKLSLPGGYAHENKQFPSSSRLLSANQGLKPSDACQPENIWLYTQLQLMHCQYLVLSQLRYVVGNCDIVQCTYFQVFFLLAISAMTQKRRMPTSGSEEALSLMPNRSATKKCGSLRRSLNTCDKVVKEQRGTEFGSQELMF